MFQESTIVSLREICPIMCPSGFLSCNGGVGYCFCYIEHEVQLKRGNKFGIVNVILVLDYSISETLFQLSNFSAGFFEGVLVSEYSDVLLHCDLHVCPMVETLSPVSCLRSW